MWKLLSTYNTDAAVYISHEQAEIVRACDRYNLPADSVTLESVHIRDPFTCVVVRHKQLVGVGFSKCGPNDTNDVNVGLSIATFRAVKDLESQFSE